MAVPSDNPHRSLAITSLVSLLIGALFPWPIALLHVPLALGMAATGLLLAIGFALASWKEKLARVVLILVGVALLLAALFAGSLMYTEGQAPLESERAYRLSKGHGNKDEIGKDSLMTGALRLGKRLFQKEWEKAKSVPGLVSIQDDLRKELGELCNESSGQGPVSVSKGDLEEPYGDGTADLVLNLGQGEECLLIRLRYDPERKAFHVEGWRTKDPREVSQ